MIRNNYDFPVFLKLKMTAFLSFDFKTILFQ